MNTDAIRENLKRGTIDLLLLSLLQDRDMYGYEMRQQLTELSLGKYELKEASMYPTLYRLVDHGYLKDYNVKAGKRRVRIYYQITDNGRKYLQELMNEYRTMTEAIEHVLNHHEGVTSERIGEDER